MRIFKLKGTMKMIQAGQERFKYVWSMLPKFACISWIIILALAILGLTLGSAWGVEFVIALLGAVLAAIFQITTAYHAKVSHFLECFSRCNESYAKLNGRLIRACNGPAVDNGPNDAIIDYFNLCAEEYLMHKMGVIPDFVWDVWRAGMHDWGLKPPIHKAWDKEKNCGYYGFDLGRIVGQHH